jgi:hypothetical protein
VGAVSLDGAHGDSQGGGDLRVGVPKGAQFEYLLLPSGESEQRIPIVTAGDLVPSSQRHVF